MQANNSFVPYQHPLFLQQTNTDSANVQTASLRPDSFTAVKLRLKPRRKTRSLDKL
jgi:hypothetical protein